MMGSQIEVKSQLGQGSEFAFAIALPLASDWVAQPNQLTEADQIVGYKGPRRQILIVDDRWENRAVLSHLLEPIGFEIVEAEQGAEALKAMHKKTPDLVITDLAMPVMDGFEFLRQIRSSEKLQATKTIMVSAAATPLDQQTALNSGVDDFLVKPVDAGKLFEKLATHLNVVWCYEEKEGSPNDQSAELILPSSKVLEALLELAKAGDMFTFSTEIKQLRKIDAKYFPFVASMLELSEQFMSEELEELLQQYLKGGLAHAA